jgi:bifunctional non-homologous end joining protein LigD
VSKEADLLWLLEFGAIDFHVWASRRDRPERPDYVLFDLDPNGVSFAEVVQAAWLLREVLDLLGLTSCVKTTGGSGLHVQVPLARRHTHVEAREFSRIVASTVARAERGLVTLEPKATRPPGVFLDTKMNGHGQQVVAPYCVRPGQVPAVATPLAWSELHNDLDPRQLTMAVVVERFRRLGDLHEPVLHGTQRLAPALERIRAAAAA